MTDTPRDDRWVRVDAGGTSVQMFLPHVGSDYIQTRIRDTAAPYEGDMLDVMLELLGPGDLVLDVGANVGNHTLVLAAAGGCRVVAYEPQHELAAAIETSAQANDLADRVTVRPVAVGAAAARGRFSTILPTNRGGQAVERAEDDGEFAIVALDDETLPGAVAGMKIDVEGFELAVLRGARSILETDHPHLWIEAGTRDEFEQVREVLDDLGYVLAGSYNATPTHLFSHRSRALVPERLAAEVLRMARERYALITSRDNAWRRLTDAVDRQEWLTQQLAAASAAPSSEDADAMEQRYVRVALERAQAESRQLRTLHTRAAEKARSESAAAEVELAAARERIAELEAEVDHLSGRRVLLLADVVGRTVRRPREILAAPRAVGKILRRPRAERGQDAGSRGAPARTATRVASDAWLPPDQLHAAEARARRGAARLRATTGTRSRLRIAAIVDEFTARGLAADADLRNVRRHHWEADLAGFDPDLLFVESAWRGAEGTWHSAVDWYPPQLESLVAWCRERSIPTVFWNKEDPVHFDKYLKVAREADVVLTTDVDMVPHYVRELGHRRVGFLPFAAQPREHAPFTTRDRRAVAVFAGAYYRRYPDRMRDMDALLGGAADVLPVEIYDRNLGSTTPDNVFPPELARHVVGTLAPDEIDVAYQGGTVALTVNTVKASSSMLARRAYELLLSGTPTVSNYARGVRTMLGDLVPAHDGRREIADAVRRIVEDDAHRERLVASGVQKILREDTYAHRLDLVVATILGEEYAPRPRAVAVLAQVADEAALDRLLETLRRQRDVDVDAFVRTDGAAVRDAAAAAGLAVVDPADAAHASLADLTGGLPVAVLDTRDWYGPRYLFSLVGAHDFAPGHVVTKAGPFELSPSADDAVRHHRAAPYSHVDASLIDPRAALLPAPVTRRLSVADVLGDQLELGAAPALAVDAFDYCRDGGAAASRMAALTLGESLDTGVPVSELVGRASVLAAEVDLADDPLVVAPDDLPTSAPAGSNIRVARQRLGGVAFERTTGGADEVLWARGTFPVADLVHDGKLTVRLDGVGDLRMLLAVRLVDASGRRLWSKALPANSNQDIPLPDAASDVQVGVRLGGTGTAVMRRICLAPRSRVPRLVVRPRRTLLVTIAYPAHGDLYKHAFVHSRVTAYQSRGEPVDVFVLTENRPYTAYEFDGVDVQRGTIEDLTEIVTRGGYEHLAVHFMTRGIWTAVKDSLDDTRLTVWVHGSEVQPWWRREFNFTDEAALQQAKVLSEERLRLWREIADVGHPHVSYVFVSEYFRHEVETDLQRSLPAERRHIIPNPIDTDLFSYRAKSPDARHRVLTIRPYTSRKYANDLSVAAVLELAEEPWFDEMHFTFVGDGPLFEETLEPLRSFTNVTIRRGYLTPSEIAALHGDHGVFLSPTRMDSQGVSRDEAMASGLVPVTTRVAAVPEFVSEAEGHLTEPEDAQGLADALREIRRDADGFLRRSAASAARVRRQSSAVATIPLELDLLREIVGA
ncbi:methyltransferase FkbM family [Beutenbergia cavernae DSM 12333]|uniref:Methyltransferase FkbM family n=1 Tax=Beutenbergia cavernae (strain ATCC BAA-8 / DSM 12333 / CCUG 43141 / JCM 11478 / NBRC 16432 / NCIMB 13614 / HKI 0122) TaxID=471853 RepID=C5C150_BEUC1|nr:FkbM family methyltransferase [Beutenbergia cavernae]ACQ79454.1 methyltransferase FkbM family [Beutenbergia cavernae DSM 12333]